MGSVVLPGNLQTFLFEADDVGKPFKVEKKKASPDEDVLHLFRLVKRRMDLGWWDDDEYKNRWTSC